MQILQNLRAKFEAVGVMRLCVALVLVSVVALTGCGSSGGGGTAIAPTTPSATFAQLERLAIPASNELCMDFRSHDTSNRVAPVDDQAFQAEFIRSFVKSVGRPPEIAEALVAVVVPDVILADLSQPTGTYFGVQLTGLGAAAPNFGGRRPTDDVIDVTLSVTFGSAVTNITQGVIPGLLTDNVGPSAIKAANAFPYLGSPI